MSETENSQQDQLIQTGFPSKQTPVVVNKLSVEYVQEGDSNSDEFQILDISTDDAGGGVYYVLKTERWAFDSIDDLIKILKDFEKRKNGNSDLSQPT